MPKVVVDSKKGLVQEAGQGLTLKDVGLALSKQSVDAPAAAAAAAASRILVGSSVVWVTQANGANDRAYLPSPTSVPNGHIVIIADAEGNGFELSSEGDGTTATTINGTAVTNGAGVYSKELAIAANVCAIAVKTGANAWHVGTLAVGTPD